MPGITGLAGCSAELVNLPSMIDRLETSVAFIRQEWTDTAGPVGLGRIALGFINIGARPAQNEDGSRYAVLTGEIHESAGHRQRLQAAGHRFRGDGHAELLLHGMEQHGTAFLRGLNGSYAAAVWDGNARTLTLVNDRFGMRPLYYVHLPGRLLFASEIKALLTDPEVSRSLNPRGLAQFFTFGHYFGEDTSFASIHLLPAAGVLTYDVAGDRITIDRYTRLGENWQTREDDSREALDRIDKAFKRSVDRCTDGPEKLGLSLSGGLDARTMLGVIDPRREVTTVCLGMEGSMDVRSAAAMARIANRRHHTHTLETRFLSRFEDHMRHMVHLTDGQYLCQCIVMPTLPLYHELGIQVLLRGHAGELMHMTKAYNFSLDPRELGISGKEVEGWLWRHLQAFMMNGVEGDLFTPTYQQGLAALARESLRDSLRQSEMIDPPVHRIWHVFISERLRRETALSMVEFGSVVETRLPYLDGELIDALMAIPPELKLDDVLQSYILGKRMPAFLDVINANTGARMGAGRLTRAFARLKMKVLGKLGVKGYQPYERLGLWLRRELRPIVERLLLSERCLNRGVFNPDAVRAVVANHLANRRNHTYLLMAMMIFELGQREFVDGDAYTPGSAAAPKETVLAS